MASPYDFDVLVARVGHPAVRLLRADNAALVLGFVGTAFLEPNVRSMPLTAAAEQLTIYLDSVNGLLVEEQRFVRSADDYLTEWSRPATGWLRKHYPMGRDQAEIEPMPAAEKAASFVVSLGPREFIGTESRLLVIRDLLRQITAGAAVDPEHRLTSLRRQRAELDALIAEAEAGDGPAMNDLRVRERYAQVVATSRDLLADMREVQALFRTLDRDVRRRAASWDGPRAELLELVFGSQQSIGGTDQGRSFQAFWEFLLSSTAQSEFNELLAQLRQVPILAGKTGEVESLLRDDLYAAARGVQRTVASLSDQLARFLDDRHWAQERRINTLIREVLGTAQQLAQESAGAATGKSELPDVAATLRLPVERPLYTPRSGTELDADAITFGDVSGIDLTDVFELTGLDIARLRANLTASIAEHDGVATLAQVSAEHPIMDGLAEVIGYIELADEESQDDLADEPIEWIGPDNAARIGHLRRIQFTSGERA